MVVPPQHRFVLSAVGYVLSPQQKLPGANSVISLLQQEYFSLLMT